MSKEPQPSNPPYATAQQYAYGNEADQRLALVQATLALAYEQRTANLIAAFAAITDHGGIVTILESDLNAPWLAEQIAARLLPVTRLNDPEGD